MVKSLVDLPLENLEEIVSQLPIETILECRCACKTLLDLISCNNPCFATLYSPNATENLIVQFASDFEHLSSLHFVDPQALLDAVDNPLKELRINPIFKIPKLRIERHDPSYTYRTIAKVLNDFALINASKGLLYFALKYTERYSLVCNPITSEYIRVPEVDHERRLQTSTSSQWLGFSETSGKYKVLRIYSTWGDHNNNTITIGAHIHEVGSMSWRDVESEPLHDIDWEYSHVLIEESLGLWLCQYDEQVGQYDDQFGQQQQHVFIVYFDFDTELFGNIPAPESFDEYRLRDHQLMSIGMVGGGLHLIDNTDDLDIWAMDESGRWIKKFACVYLVNKPSFFKTNLRPLQLLNKCEILMVSADSELVCFDMRNKFFKFINFNKKIKPKFKAVSFVPSFVSAQSVSHG